MPAVAFFDLDRTLIACNSATLWLREEMRAGNVGPLEALKAVAWIARYSLGAADMEEAILATIGALKGRSEAEIDSRTLEFYQRVVRPQLRPKGKEALSAHRARSDKLVLLTSSSIYLSRLVGRDLELDDLLCTRLEVDGEGLFTGRPIGRPCFGTGKLQAARDYVDRVGVSLSECTFYTDSASDLPVLEADRTKGQRKLRGALGGVPKCLPSSFAQYGAVARVLAQRTCGLLLGLARDEQVVEAAQIEVLLRCGLVKSPFFERLVVADHGDDVHWHE
jgi:HAD superfamily hydrolase (TIGR01490 family)